MSKVKLGGGRVDAHVGVRKGKGGIVAKLIAYSQNPKGQRIATFELEYPRTIHAEVRTHCMLDMNSSSSRAIPAKRMREHTQENLALPVILTKNQSGMQGREIHDGLIDLTVVADIYHQTISEVDEYFKKLGVEIVGGKISYEDFVRYWTLRSVVADHEILERSGLHKQIVNRSLEPYQFIKVVLTGTEFDNFFNLRFHQDADPNLIELANCMASLYYECVPEVLEAGEWHTPYVEHCRGGTGKLEYYTGVVGEEGFRFHSAQEAAMISCCACAQVSYRKLDLSPEKVERVFNLLINDGIIHGSAFSHVATPMHGMSHVYDLNDVQRDLNFTYDPSTWEDGITHVDREGNLWSSKFKGWIQFRKLIRNECCTNFDYETRKQEVYSTEIGSQLSHF